MRTLCTLAVLALLPLQAEAQRQSIAHAGQTRSFVVRTPTRVTQGTKLPVVLVLHGGGGNAANVERQTGFSRIVNRDTVIVVYPEGSSRLRSALLTWNAGHCCGFAMQRSVDDVGFINTLLDTLIAKYPVDPARIFVTGLSNGGMMAQRLGRELSPRIAAIAPVIAAMFGDEPAPRSPVSALMINGMQDESVPYQGGPPGGPAKNAWDGTPAIPALDAARYWARANGCSEPPEARVTSPLRHTRYRCPDGRGVELYLIEDNGHAWPGGEKGRRRANAPSQALDATETIWAFFKAHGRT